MANEALIKAATEIDPDLNARLEAMAKAADRSKAGEIRQAIRAWVEDEDGDSKAGAAA